MRTNIDIDEALLQDVIRLSGITTKREAVDRALRVLRQRLRSEKALTELEGIGWDEDLGALRSGFAARTQE